MPADSAADLTAVLADEQQFVDRAYTVLDELREDYRTKQAQIAAQASSNPSAKADRDALAAHYDDEATRLSGVENHLVFGYLEQLDGTGFHVGRIGLRDSTFADTSLTQPLPPDDEESLTHQLLVDWRAQIASPFYQATAREPLGVVRRRHIATSLRKVVSVEDELLDTQTDTGKVVLQGEGALMAALAQARDGRMQDIVATIQQEQDRVIRSDLDTFLVVQGGPGTGKTSVALHRGAYLLYAHRQRLENQGVLVVGPSPAFMRYIERVLPALGETGVVSVTLGECYPGVATVTEESRIRAVKGSLKWIDILKTAVADLQRPPADDLEIRLGNTTLMLRAKQVQDAMHAAWLQQSTHNQAWEVYAKILVSKLAEQYAGKFPDREELDWTHEEVRTSPLVRRLVNTMFIPSSPLQLLERLFAYPDYLERIAGGLLSTAERNAVYRPKGSPFTDADVPLLDELAELLGPLPDKNRQISAKRSLEKQDETRAREAMEALNLGDGIVNARMLAESVRGETTFTPLAQRARADRTWVYGHVIVDEAQELSPMDWHLLLRRCPSRSFTVVGDVNQASRFASVKQAPAWAELLGPAMRTEPVIEKLTVNYRTPRRIMEAANRVLEASGRKADTALVSAREVPEALAVVRIAPQTDRTGLPEEIKKTIFSEVSRLEQSAGAGNGKVAVIVPAGSPLPAQLELEASDPVQDQVCCLSPVAAKGLEFDTVILVDPLAIAVNPGDLYVAMTRPTQRLCLLGTEFPPGLENTKPEPVSN